MKYTRHARDMMRARRISEEAVEYAVNCGREYRMQREYFYCLNGYLPHHLKRYRRLVVILTPDQVVKTVYFNAQPQQHLRRKKRYNHQDRRIQTVVATKSAPLSTV